MFLLVRAKRLRADHESGGRRRTGGGGRRLWRRAALRAALGRLRRPWCGPELGSFQFDVILAQIFSQKFCVGKPKGGVQKN